MSETKKFKEGKYCGFRPNNKCNEYCGLYNIGLGACVLHSINLNLNRIAKSLEKENANNKQDK